MDNPDNPRLNTALFNKKILLMGKLIGYDTLTQGLSSEIKLVSTTAQDETI